MNYQLVKKDAERRYTLGVLYVPSHRDAHGEHVEANELQRATWDYMRKGKLRLRDQHTSREIGDVVEIMTLPAGMDFPVEGTTRKFNLPAGTVVVGVIWDEDAWLRVKRGEIKGLSLGGRAVRVRDAVPDGELPRMGSVVAKSTRRPGLVAQALADANAQRVAGSGIQKGRGPRTTPTFKAGVLTAMADWNARYRRTVYAPGGRVASHADATTYLHRPRLFGADGERLDAQEAERV